MAGTVVAGPARAAMAAMAEDAEMVAKMVAARPAARTTRAAMAEDAEMVAKMVVTVAMAVATTP